MKSLVESIRPIQKLNITRHITPSDDAFPNNGRLPLLLYHHAFTETEDVDTIKELLETNSWTNAWVNGIHDYHHYHSTAHEVLVALKGSARVQFGGPNGITLPFEKGDVVIIPAGVAHKRIEQADGFTCLGAYASGKEFDMNYGKKEERPHADENIRALPLPENDPLYGSDGPLVKSWFPESNHTAHAL
jgi:uncharacterized protein YjlB